MMNAAGQAKLLIIKKITKPLADDGSEVRQIEHLTGILEDIEKTFCGKRRDKKVLIISQKGKEEIFREEDILYIERKEEKPESISGSRRFWLRAGWKN